MKDKIVIFKTDQYGNRKIISECEGHVLPHVTHVVINKINYRVFSRLQLDYELDDDSCVVHIKEEEKDFFPR